MPRDILGAPGISNMLDRTKISNRFAVGNLATFIKAGGGNLDDFHLSKLSVCNKRNKNLNMEYEKFYNEFQAPKHSVVGWDGKVVKTVMGSDKSVDYLAIVLSGAPNMMEGKILEVEEMTDSRGETQCQTTFNVLTACRASDSVRALLFDTTASNTGVKKGAAQLLLQKFGRPLMWFECCHHMSELFIKPVWVMLFGEDCSPFRSDISLFKTTCPYIIKDNFIELNHQSWLELQLKETTVQLLTSILTIPNNKA